MAYYVLGAYEDMSGDSKAYETSAGCVSMGGVRRQLGLALLSASALCLAACGSAEPEHTASTSNRDLQLDPDFEPDNPLVHAQPDQAWMSEVVLRPLNLELRRTRH